MTISIVVLLLFLHLVGDFFFQTDEMALNKSKSWVHLYAHVTVYALFFSFFGAYFWLITLVTHGVTDAITSRITSKLWFIEFVPGVTSIVPEYPFYARVIPGKRHWFFVMIGVDQFIHYVTLLLTYKFLFL